VIARRAGRLVVAPLAVVCALAARGAAAADAPDAGADADASNGGAGGPDVDAAGAGRDGAAPRDGSPEAAAGAALRVCVVERGTRRPLPGTTVFLDSAAVGETDASGCFTGVASAGTHRLQLEVPAHEALDRRVDLEGKTGELLYRLSPLDDGERYETVVRAAHPEMQQIALSGEEARRTPGAGNDPVRALASLPGVAQIAWPAALFVVRGANPGNTGYFLDGLRVPALFHLALGPAVIHPYLIAGLDFFPGSYPPSYGGFASGIVAARTVAAPLDRVHASADVTLYDAAGIVTAPFDGGRGGVVAAARYSYAGPLLAALSETSVISYGDYQLRVDHPLAGGQATLFAFGSLDQLGWTYALGLPTEYASLQFHRVDLRWRRELGGGSLAVAAAAGADWSGSTLFERSINVRALSATPRIRYERALGAAADLTLGGDAELQRFATQVPAFQRRQSDLGRSRDAASAGLYGALALRLGPRLVLAPGLRLERFAEEGVHDLAVEPRIDASVRLSPALVLRGSAGRMAQMPSLPVSVPGFESFGLADLGLQTSTGGALALEASLPRHVTASLTGYYQALRLTDVRNIDINPTAIDPTAPDYLVSRRGRAYGAELLVRRAGEGRLYGWLAYTLSFSLREDDDGVLGRSDWDERHILNLVAGWRFGHGWSAGARFHFNSGRLAPIFGSGGEYRELPAFYQLDLRADRRFVFDRFTLDFYVDLGNATLTREVVQLDSIVDPATGRLIVQEESFQLVLPTIGVHAEI
jgi:hypothetical protein